MSKPLRQRVSLLDATFLRIEKRESPMHVASLQIFQIPEGAGTAFVRELEAALEVRTPHQVVELVGATA